MKKKVILPLLLLVILLAACGGADTASVAEPVVQEVALDLPDEVDVYTVESIKNRDDVYLLDVREQSEYDQEHIPGVTLLPMGQVPNNLDQIPTDKAVIVTCRTGNRSGQVADFLRQNGFDNIHNMQGGIVAWQQAGFDVEK